MMRKGRLARLARLGGMAAGLVGDVAGATTHLVTESTNQAAASLHQHAAQRMLKGNRSRGEPLSGESVSPRTPFHKDFQ